MKGDRRIFRLQGPGNDVDYTQQKRYKASQGNLLYQSGQLFSEVEERFSDPNHCEHFLASNQESWFKSITPDSVYDKEGTKECARADVTEGRVPERNLEEPINSLPPFSSKVSIEGGQAGSDQDHVHYPPPCVHFGLGVYSHQCYDAAG